MKIISLQLFVKNIYQYFKLKYYHFKKFKKAFVFIYKYIKNKKRNIIEINRSI